jgi:sugar lactone lactonase YvrE
MPRGCSLSDDQETLVVVDAENNRLVLLRASDGALLQTFGAEEAGAGQLNLPSCVSMSQQKLWVSDASNHRVLCFDEGPNHHVLFQFGRSEEAGSDDHHFTIPSGVAVHGYKVFVADFRNHRVQVFDDVSGECIYTIGGEQGQLPGQLAGPEGIAIDHGRDLLYVCEGINRRVSVFNASTFAYVGRITTPSNTQRPAEFQYPIAVTVDAGSAEVYVSDFAHARVHVFSAF